MGRGFGPAPLLSSIRYISHMPHIRLSKEQYDLARAEIDAHVRRHARSRLRIDQAILGVEVAGKGAVSRRRKHRLISEMTPDEVERQRERKRRQKRQERAKEGA